MFFRRRALTSGLLLLGLGCTTAATTSVYQPYTALYVDPADFLGDVRCADDAGTVGDDTPRTGGLVRSYVTTLYDVTANDPEQQVLVASSPPTSCRSRTIFSQVARDHFYVAQIDAYDLPACPYGTQSEGCLSPLIALSPGAPTAERWRSGSRVMVRGQARKPIVNEKGEPTEQVEDTQVVEAPGWVTRCGRLATEETGGAGGVSGQGGAGASGTAGQSGAAGQGGAGASGTAGLGGAAEAGAGGSASGGQAGQEAGSGEAGSGGSGAGGQAGEAGAGGRISPLQRYDVEGPTEVVYQTQSRMIGCVGLAAPEGPSTVLVSTEGGSELLGGLRCGNQPGEVERLEIRVDGGAPRSLSCGEAARFDDLGAVSNVRFVVFAYESGASGARWGSVCNAQSRAGETSSATCAPLSERGSLEVPGATLCGAGIDRYQVTPVGLGVSAQGQLCPASLTLNDLPAGLVDLTVRLYGGDAVQEAVCSGQVVPGQHTQATCTL